MLPGYPRSHAGLRAVGESGPFAVPALPPFFSVRGVCNLCRRLRGAILQRRRLVTAALARGCIVTGGSGVQWQVYGSAASVAGDRTVAALDSNRVISFSYVLLPKTPKTPNFK